jgi:hypothetical protein
MCLTLMQHQVIEKLLGLASRYFAQRPRLTLYLEFAERTDRQHRHVLVDAMALTEPASRPSVLTTFVMKNSNHIHGVMAPDTRKAMTGSGHLYFPFSSQRRPRRTSFVAKQSSSRAA